MGEPPVQVANDIGGGINAAWGAETGRLTDRAEREAQNENVREL
jgi:hypothetical protein